MTATTASKSKLPRGIRNNNPGNIRDGSDKWQGLSGIDDDDQFAVFTDPTWGIRALARILINYQDKYNLRTVAEIINRWAPPSENNTRAYVERVCEAMEVAPHEALDMHEYKNLCPLVEEIINHENGRGPIRNANTWYKKDVIDEGLRLAGVVKKAATVDKVPVTKETVGATGTAVVGAAGLADAAPQIIATIQGQEDHLTSGSYMRIGIAVLTIGFALFIAWSQVKKHEQGLVA